MTGVAETEEMLQFKTGYLDPALFNLDKVIKRAKKNLADVDFDTLVGTGLSGALVVPALALAMGKSFVLVRKDNDDSHHGSGHPVGTLGKRWIFLDDFISSGETRRRVLDKIKDEAGYRGHLSKYVGDYCYAKWSTYGCKCKTAACIHQGIFTPVPERI